MNNNQRPAGVSSVSTRGTGKVTLQNRFLGLLTVVALAALIAAATVWVATVNAPGVLQVQAQTTAPDRILTNLDEGEDADLFEIREAGTPGYNPTTHLGYISDCGLEDAPECTDGVINLLNLGTTFSTTDSIDGDDEFDFLDFPSNVDLDDAKVSDLFAAYLVDENVNLVGNQATNYILPDSDKVIVVVEDSDQILREAIIQTQETATFAGSAQSGFLIRTFPILDVASLPIVDVDGDDSYTDDVFATAVLATGGVITRLPINTEPAAGVVLDDGRVALPDPTVNLIVSSVEPGSIRADGTLETPGSITIICVPQGNSASCGRGVGVNLNWNTASADSRAWVQLESSVRDANDVFLALTETTRGSGVFTGAFTLIDNLVEDNLAAANAAANVTSYASGSRTMPYVAVSDGGSITVIYRDKTGVTGNRDEPSQTNRREDVSIDSAAPEIDVEAPLPGDDNDEAITGRDPRFSGTASDSGNDASGLKVERELNNLGLTLVIDNRIDPAPGNSSEALGGITSSFGYVNFGNDFTTPEEITSGNVNYHVVPGVEADIDEGLFEDDINYKNGTRNPITWQYKPNNDGDLLEDRVEDEQLNHIVDFQLYAIDLAGNIGFSDRDDDDATPQAHLLILDGIQPGLIDPDADAVANDEIEEAPYEDRFTDLVIVEGGTGEDILRLPGLSITGIEWNNNQLQVDRRSIMVVFNEEVSNFDPTDFRVIFDNGPNPDVIDLIYGSDADEGDLDDGDIYVKIGSATYLLVEKPESDTMVTNCGDLRAQIVGTSPAEYNYTVGCNLLDLINRSVFLTLNSDIPSDDTPRISVDTDSQGRDRAGRSVNTGFDNISIEDGLGPRVTLALSGGTGSGSDDDNQGPSTLTNDEIRVSITADEEPSTTLVEYWQEDPDSSTPDSSIERTDTSTRRVTLNQSGTNYVGEEDFSSTVRDDKVYVVVRVTDDADNTTIAGYDVTQSANNNRFVDSNGDDRDETTVFNFDNDAPRFATDFNDDQESSNVRETILITFDAGVANISRAEIDSGTGTPQNILAEDLIAADQQLRAANNDQIEWIYAPTSDFAVGTYTIRVDATDWAGNKVTNLNYTLEIQERKDFVISIRQGLNLISFPSDPVDPSVGSVFTDPGIIRITTFEARSRNQFRVVRRDSETGRFSGEFTNIKAGAGYFVVSDTFHDVKVRLSVAGDSAGSAITTPPRIDTATGWNLIGVLDSTLENVEGDSGVELPAPIGDGNYTLSDYLSANTQISAIVRYDLSERDYDRIDPQGTTIIKTGEAYWVDIRDRPANPITP